MYNHDPGQSSCNECEKGYYCVGNSSKVACPKGRYLNTTKGTSFDDCLECSKGYYNDLLGQGSCKSCDPGKYLNATGQSNCTNCSIFRYF